MTVVAKEAFDVAIRVLKLETGGSQLQEFITGSLCQDGVT